MEEANNLINVNNNIHQKWGLDPPPQKKRFKINPMLNAKFI